MAPGGPDRGVHAALNAALNAPSRAAATEGAADAIGENTVMPLARRAAIDTLFDQASEHAAAINGRLAVWAGSAKARRISAPTPRVLIAPDAGDLTGQTLRANGGLAKVR